MPEFSFDVVSKVDLQEVRNAVDQASREIATRYDFKGSVSEIRLEKDQVQIRSDDDYKLKAVIDVFQSKLVRRGIDLKAMEYGKVEPASGGTVRQTITVRQGIDPEIARDMVKRIKALKLKVQTQVQEDQLRVSGKTKDDLQAVIQLLRSHDFGIPLQFVNYRS
ncbi:MAG: YajQ family cyclic di-GMP-binding protein [Armatimonadetes bacterium]|nr:YajQ family cyclic di-GMP-binding protein [Armatimonadota bacterium]